MNVRALILSIFCVLIVGTASAQASLLTFSFTDPVGDQLSRVDLTGLHMTFDNVTGAYTIDLFADTAHPFNGSFRLNINLFNPDTGTTAQDPSFFQDTLNDITLASPSIMQTLTGTNLRLLAWEVGDPASRLGALPWGTQTGQLRSAPPLLTCRLALASSEIYWGLPATSTAQPMLSPSSLPRPRRCPSRRPCSLSVSGHWL